MSAFLNRPVLVEVAEDDPALDPALDPDPDYLPDPPEELCPEYSPTVTTVTPESRILTLEQRLHARRDMGPRIPTGIAALDDLLRGGIRPQQVMVIGGAPGAGKTTLGVQIARFMARAGVAVSWLAIDEEPAGIDARNLESIGILRDLAEEPDEQTIARAVFELGPLPWLMLDDATVEDAFVQLAKRYPHQQRAIFIDSIQTAWTTTSGAIPSIRERISDVIQTAKRCARLETTRAAVFLTSELARGAYRSRDASEQIEDLAAFKESGAIEYQGHVLLVLRTDPEDAAAVTVSVPKNRIGRRGTFGLRLEFASATFRHRELPDSSNADVQREAAKRTAGVARVRDDARELARIIQREPGIGERELRAAIAAAGLKWGKDRLGAAKRVLATGETGVRLVNRGPHERKAEWHVEPVEDCRSGGNDE